MRRFPSLIFILALAFVTACGNSPSLPAENPNGISDTLENNSKAVDSAEGDTSRADDEMMMQEIEFGFANTEGNKVLTIKTEDFTNPEKFSKAIAKDGGLFDIRFLKQKEATEKDNGRQNEYNFDDCAGYVYKVDGGKVSTEQSVILTTADFLKQHVPIKLNAPVSNSLSNATRTKIEAEKGRKIKQYKLLRQLEDDQGIWLLVFQQKGDSALASLAMVSAKNIVYQDFPALYDEISTWRVDDGGEFGLDDIHILAAFDYAGKIEIVTDWAGAEGFSINFLQEDGKAFRSLKNDGRYCAPL